ncbi:hypothetical protein EVAR_7074_1 [Eumeta japonica]|uniref:RNase H type-1 domain-containing protein n=1 Tax=Eumeta variegata TaxID=151549 RepID=A0A4C1X8G1_EUMVA|nr:hypothetical protein EVAR_7074_1 [Eumeta japonica]
MKSGLPTTSTCEKIMTKGEASSTYYSKTRINWAVRLFWVGAYAGIADNERADELARRAALAKKTAADYDKFTLSYAKKVIRATLMGYGGFAQYLYRFKLQDSPYCAYDPAKIKDVLHVLEVCDMFHRERVVLEAETDIWIARRNFPEITEEAVKRIVSKNNSWLSYITRVSSCSIIVKGYRPTRPSSTKHDMASHKRTERRDVQSPWSRSRHRVNARTAVAAVAFDIASRVPGAASAYRGAVVLLNINRMWR